MSSSTAPDKQARLERLERELDEMGGRQAYQSASLLSVSFHNTSKWVTKQLAGKMGLRPANGEPPLRVLEVIMRGRYTADAPVLLGQTAGPRVCCFSSTTRRMLKSVHVVPAILPGFRVEVYAAPAPSSRTTLLVRLGSVHAAARVKMDNSRGKVPRM